MVGSGKYVSNYYFKEVKLFFRLLTKLRYNPNSKSIHKIRTAIKKIRVVFQLISYVSPEVGKSLKLNKGFKKIFQIAGHLRELYINRLLIAQYKLPYRVTYEYNDFLSLQEKKLLSKLKKVIGELKQKTIRHSRQIIRKRLDASKNSEIRKKCLEFIRRETDQIQQVGWSKNHPVIIHQVRLHLKRIEVIAEILRKLKKEENLNQALAIIKETLALIGEWHDSVVLANSLEEFFRHKHKTSSVNFSDKLNIKEQIAVENRKLMIKIKLKTANTLESIQSFLFF